MTGRAISPSPGEGVPRYLALDPHPVLAFLHSPDPGQRRPTAVLMCPPFGWEEMTSYRARRTWAQRLAASGYPTVRFDLPTTGDSGGSALEASRPQMWTHAIAQMIEWLRCQGDRVAVFGIGLGGLLAWEAVLNGAVVDDLLMWAVPANGRALLREQRAYARIIAAGNAPDHSDRAEDDAEELIGYRLSAEAKAELEALKPEERELRIAPRRVLLVSRDEVSVPSGQAEHFKRAGSEVTVETVHDFEALVALPQLARHPTATIERSIAWLNQARPEGGQRRSAAGADLLASADSDSTELVWEGASLRETAVSFEAAGYRVFGILTGPAEGPPAALTAVMPGSGALRHTGPNRAWVELARRWAAQGVMSLRFDQPGIGDSSGDERELVDLDSLYAPRTVETVLEALNWLAAQGPARAVCDGWLVLWGVLVAPRRPRRPAGPCCPDDQSLRL